MQASVAGEISGNITQAVESNKHPAADHVDNSTSRDFFWDHLITVITTGMLLTAALDIITSLTSDPVKCQTPDHFTRDQSAFVNSYCSEKTPKVDYLLFYIVGQAVVLVGPHFLWKSWFSGKLSYFTRLTLSLERHRESKTGEYVLDNFVKVYRLKTSFGKSKMIHMMYFAKVLLQICFWLGACICCWVPFYEPDRKEIFHVVFNCEYTGPQTEYLSLENYMFTTTCVVPALRSHYAVWITNLILLFGVLCCLCIAVGWWIGPHKILNWKEASIFSLQSGIHHNNYDHWFSYSFRIKTDLDFLLLRVYGQDEGHGNVLRELLIMSTVKDHVHKAKETLNLMKGNEGTGKRDPDSVKPSKFKLRAVTPTIVKVSWKPPESNADSVKRYVVTYHERINSQDVEGKEIAIDAKYCYNLDKEYDCIIDGLQPLTRYYFKLQAVYHDGDGPPTSPQYLRMPPENEWKFLSELSCLLPITFGNKERKMAENIFKAYGSSKDVYTLVDILLELARSKDYGFSKDKSVIAVDLEFGGNGYSFALAGISDDCKVVSVNLDSHYLNEEESSDHRTFVSGIHTVKTLSDIYAQPTDISTQFTNFVAECLQDKKEDSHCHQAKRTVQLFVVGPFSDPDRVMTIHWFLYFLVRGGYVDFHATLLVIKPLKVGRKDVEKNFQDFQPISPWDPKKKMERNVKVKSGSTTCTFRISLYKVSKWLCSICKDFSDVTVEVKYCDCYCVDKVCHKCAREQNIPERKKHCLNHPNSKWRNTSGE
jgi:hypothetical protein